jgi:hypothetical protein
MSTSSRSLLSIAALLTLIAGCGQSPAATVDAGRDAAGSDAASSDDVGPLADTGTTDAGAVDAASAEDAAPSSDVTVTISDLAVFGNCMPIVAPDPIHAGWTVAISGATGPAATLTSATLTLMSSPPIVQTLTVDSPTVLLLIGSGMAMQQKVSADMNPSMACGATCGADARLSLTFMVDGAPVTATADGVYECTF